MEQYLTQDNIVLVALVFWVLVQSKVFCTRLDLEKLRNEVLHQKLELQKYSDEKDEILLHKIEEKYELILEKLDKIK